MNDTEIYLAHLDAQATYARAYNELADARRAVTEAEQRFYEATEQLVKLESKPGVPLKATK